MQAAFNPVFRSQEMYVVKLTIQFAKAQVWLQLLHAMLKTVQVQISISSCFIL